MKVGRTNKSKTIVERLSKDGTRTEGASVGQNRANMEFRKIFFVLGKLIAGIFIGFPLLALSAGPASWETLVPGDNLGGGPVKIGVFSFELPPGDWFVTAKYRSPNVRWSTGAGPVYVEMAFATIERGQVRAMIHLATLADPVFGVLWESLENRCNPRNPLLIIHGDWSSNYKYPECLWIISSQHSRWPTNGTPDSFGNQQLEQIRKIPAIMDDSALNIRYFRTYRADYLHFNAILPQKNDKSLPPEIEAWAKQVKVELDKVIKREVSTGVIPKLPVTSSQ